MQPFSFVSKRQHSRSLANLAWLSLFFFFFLHPNSSTTAFSPPICQLNSQSNPSKFYSSILQTPIEDDAVGTNSTTSPSLQHETHDDDTSMRIPKPKFSKAKWKKKRYHMIRDVQLLIQQQNPNAPKKAEEMVRRMLKLYENSGNDLDFRPTLQAYNLWIHALARSNWENAGVLAEQVMEEMRDQKIWPNGITYSSVMDAYARSQSPERAEEILFRLLEEAPSTGGGVSVVTCDTMLNAWAQQGTIDSAERAEMILFRLEEWQREDIRPTKISYATGTFQ